MKYNTKEIMCKAWEIYRATDQGDGIRPIFSLCLKMAWENAKNAPERVMESWRAMTEMQQYNMLKANVRRAAKDEIKYSTEDHYNEFNEDVAWLMQSHDLDGFVNDAWLKLAEALDEDHLEELNERRAEAGKMNISLVSLVYRAAAYAIRSVYRAEIKHVRARVQVVKDKNGDEVEYIDTMASSRRDNTEAAAMAAVGLEQFLNSRDEIDRIIIEAKRDGYTQKEIAAMVGISDVAIHKRMKKIRAAGVEAGLCMEEKAA